MTIRVRPLTGVIGAIVEGVDLSRSPDPETVQRIRHEMLQHLVVFFEPQSLSPAQLHACASLFGNPAIYPFAESLDGFPNIVRVVKREHEKMNFGGVWHSDTTYLPVPPMGTLLYALQIPPCGGDTLFANQYLAYESLSEGMRCMLSQLVGVNRSDKLDETRCAVRRASDEPDPDAHIAEHPVVRTHPETGRQSLYINLAHTTNFRDMTAAESAPLLEFLFQQQTRPEFCCRFQWLPGSVAFWDNRCTLHCPVNDYQGHHREMLRITLEGERPV